MCVSCGVSCLSVFIWSCPSQFQTSQIAHNKVPIHSWIDVVEAVGDGMGLKGCQEHRSVFPSPRPVVTRGTQDRWSYLSHFSSNHTTPTTHNVPIHSWRGVGGRGGGVGYHMRAGVLPEHRCVLLPPQMERTAQSSLQARPTDYTRFLVDTPGGIGSVVGVQSG